MVVIVSTGYSHWTYDGVYYNEKVTNERPSFWQLPPVRPHQVLRRFLPALKELGIDPKRYTFRDLLETPDTLGKGNVSERTVAIAPHARLPEYVLLHEVAHIMLGHTRYQFLHQKEIEADLVARYAAHVLGWEKERTAAAKRSANTVRALRRDVGRFHLSTQHHLSSPPRNTEEAEALVEERYRPTEDRAKELTAMATKIADTFRKCL